MEMAVWILFCLFASVGLVQCGFWFFESIRRTEKISRGYRLIPLYDDPENIEPQIRYGLSRISRSESVLFLDMGLGCECREIYDRLTWGIGGVHICGCDSVAEAIQNLDNLQIPPNVVEL